MTINNEEDYMTTLLVAKQYIKNFIGNGSIPFKYDKNKILLYKYSQPAYHLNGHEIRQHINNSERIEINYDRKFIWYKF